MSFFSAQASTMQVHLNSQCLSRILSVTLTRWTYSSIFSTSSCLQQLTCWGRVGAFCSNMVSGLHKQGNLIRETEWSPANMGIKRCKRVYPYFKYFFLSGNTDYRGAMLDHQHCHNSGGKPGSASNYCRTLQRSTLPKKRPVSEKSTGTLQRIVVREDR